MAARDLSALTAEIVACRACPRLVAWREEVAREKRAAFRDEEYWGRPVPGFGDPDARLLLVGLAPAAHGGNRTGRVFTGDRSGDFLFASLVPHRLREPARVGPRRRRSRAPRRLHRGRGAVRRPRTSRRRRSATRACRTWCASCSCSPTLRDRRARRVRLRGHLDDVARRRAPGRRASRRPRFAHGLEVDCGA